MLFGKRSRNSEDRVRELKARVDALRQADEAKRNGPRTLDHFLAGDDVLTGREVEDNYQPVMARNGEGSAQQIGEAAAGGAGQVTAGPDAVPIGEEALASTTFEVDLQAELDKYLEREQARRRDGAEADAGDSSAPEVTEANTGPDALGWATASDWAPQPSSGAAASTGEWSQEDWPSEEEWPPPQ